MADEYDGLELAQSATEPHLGGAIKGGDPFSYCPSVWDYVIGRFGVESVLDLGSGAGNASDYFFRKGLKVIAVEGLEESVLTSIFPALRHDITKDPVVTRVDLVHCQEVVEHIEERFLDYLLASLMCGRVILMTHAPPGEDSHHHVNLQPSEYWIDHMTKRGCSYLYEDSLRVRRLAENDGAVYMNRTGMVFLNRSRT